MKDKLSKLIWCGYPLSKLIYAFIAYSYHREINNSFEIINLLFLLIGIFICFISILLSKKIYQKTFYDNKIVKLLLGQNKDQESNKEAAIFNLFVMLLGLAESTALFGFIQYIITGNLITGIFLFVLSFVAWAFNYPGNQEDHEE